MSVTGSAQANSAGIIESIDRNGFAIVTDAIESDVIAELRTCFGPTGKKAGIRNLFENQPAVCEIARSPAVRQVVEAVLGPSCFAVQAILFDKSPETNWKVAWHQDLTIAVRERHPTAGFMAWSEKEGIVHVQPPIPFLERMLAVRVHLDDCGPSNGPLRVLPGSHREGRLDAPAVDRWKARVSEVQCVVKTGGLLLMRPLLLHASSSAHAASQRRVLHLVFAADGLPGDLEWRDHVDGCTLADHENGPSLAFGCRAT
jgi:ectoine hydroxylase-related dioxygenase (phytanoyl-CoA dioxygenase family)